LIAVIDNYDSFTYNLVQELSGLDEVVVFRNDEVEVEEIASLAPSHLVISPGPGGVEDSGISLEVVKRLSGAIPILGVCLGHQCIAKAFGGEVVRAPRPTHGKVSRIYHEGRGMFRGLPSPLVATRYHSLMVVVDESSTDLEVEARSEDGLVMAIRHKLHPTFGVQFHPESILTEHGFALLRNFYELGLRRSHPEVVFR